MTEDTLNDISRTLSRYREAAALWKSRYKEMVKTCAITGKERDNLREQVRLTIMENLHLADGDVCTLKRLKDAIGFDLDSPENADVEARRK